jgi:hypothetical protein
MHNHFILTRRSQIRVRNWSFFDLQSNVSMNVRRLMISPTFCLIITNKAQNSNKFAKDRRKLKIELVYQPQKWKKDYHSFIASIFPFNLELYWSKSALYNFKIDKMHLDGKQSYTSF